MTHTANLDISAADAFGATPWAHRAATPPPTEVVWIDEDDSVEEFLSEVPSQAVARVTAEVAPRLADRLLAARDARIAQTGADLPFVKRRWTIRISRTSWAVSLVAAAASLELLYLGGHVAGRYWHAQELATRRLPVPVLPSRSVASAVPIVAFAAPTPALEPLTRRRVEVPNDPLPGGATTAPAPASVAAVSMAASTQAAGPMGWATIDVPIQVHVFERGRFVGTNATEQLRLAAGVHELELVNDALHFRTTQTVTIQPGKGSVVQVPLPSGTLSLNALPWSEVVIGERVVGATPLGRVALSIGPHRIVFRHPELGEQTRTVVVAAGTETRLTVDLRQ